MIEILDLCSKFVFHEIGTDEITDFDNTKIIDSTYNKFRSRTFFKKWKVMFCKNLHLRSSMRFNYPVWRFCYNRLSTRWIYAEEDGDCPPPLPEKNYKAI